MISQTNSLLKFSNVYKLPALALIFWDASFVLQPKATLDAMMSSMPDCQWPYLDYFYSGVSFNLVEQNFIKILLETKKTLNL